MRRPRLFVSFSSQDRDITRRLFSRLGAQPLDLWDYSIENREIPGGADIAMYLKDRIDQCRFFIPIVTPSSLTSHYTVTEVAHALTRHRDPGFDIIPLVENEALNIRPWPPPYNALADIRYYPILRESRDSIEDAIQRLCADMGVSYVPPMLDDPRLPFLERLDREIADKCPRRDERQIGVARRLEQVRNELVHAIEEGDYDRALQRSAYFTATCEYEYPGQRFYYPYIVQAVCLISCGNLPKAMDVLNALNDHPLCDESLYGALGFIRQQQGAHREALGYYREAMRRDPADPAAKCGVLINATLCNETVDVAQLLREVNPDEIPVPGDRVKVLETKALVLAALDRTDEARVIYENLAADGSVTADGVLNFVMLLCRQGRFDAAYDLMRRFAQRFDGHANYVHYRATLCFRMGRLDEAAGHLETLVARHPANRQYRTDLAQMEMCRGRPARAETLVRPLLDRRQTPLPERADDFYYDGFANFICRRTDRAQYDFERSGFAPDHDYAAILARLGIGGP